MNISFLDKVNTDKKEDVKTIRFNKDEMYLLKFIKYRKRRFSEYVKELINRDIEAYIKDREGYFTKEDIKEIVKEVLNE